MRGIDALGEGDWKLAAMLGAFLGWEKLSRPCSSRPSAAPWSASRSWPVAGRAFQHRLPFGTFLGAAAILVVFVGDPVVGWYRDRLVH